MRRIDDLDAGLIGISHCDFGGWRGFEWGFNILSPELQRGVSLVSPKRIHSPYALKHHESNRLIFLFEPNDADDRVPFDLNTFKYVQITQAAEIPNKIGTEIKAILRDSGVSL